MIHAAALLLCAFTFALSLMLYAHTGERAFRIYAIIATGLLGFLLFMNNVPGLYPIPDSVVSLPELALSLILFTSVLITKRQTEQTQATLATLRESEEKYRGLIERSFDLIFMLDLRGKIIYLSPACERMLGYSQDELLHAEIKTLLKETDHFSLDNAYTNILKHRSSVGLTLDVERKDERFATLEFHISPVFRNAKVIGVQGIARDITESRRTEQKLRESEDRLWAIASATPFPIEVMNEDSTILFVNTAFCNLVGRRFETLIGQPSPIFRRKDTPAGNILKKLTTKGQIENFESYIIKPDGSRLWISGAIQKITFDEHPAFLTGFVDITKRKLAEEALRESEKRFKDLFKSSPNAIFVKDLQGTVLDVNPAACKLHQIKRSELIGMNDSQLLSNGTKLDTLKNYQNLFNGRSDYFEGYINTKDKRTVPVEIRANRINYSRQPAILLHVNDISERKQLEAQLLHAQKMEAIGKLAGGIAHDFNNLLTAISSYSELLLSNPDMDSPTRQDVREIQKAGERAAMLTRQLLAFGRKQIIQPEAINLNDIVKDLFNMLQRVIGENIELEIALLPDLLPVWADPAQIQQVVLNLCINARDAMPKGGKLTITTRNVSERDILNYTPEHEHGQRFTELQVVDTGVGIDPELQQRIFEPFFTTKQVNKGTGLGLSVVYGIIKQHQGIIQVDSKRGKGTTLRIYLPVKDVTLKPKIIKEETMTELFGTETIMVVEDDASVRKVAVRILSGMGYKTVTAPNGMEALKIFESQQDEIDLVLMDVVMPKYSGPDTYKRLNQIRPHLPVVFVTGYDVNSEIRDVDILEKRCVNLLQKPYTRESLSTKIRELLDGNGGP